jgi:hypothetical protein
LKHCERFLPDIGGSGAMNDFRAKIAPELFDARYPEPFPKGLDGEGRDQGEDGGDPF